MKKERKVKRLGGGGRRTYHDCFPFHVEEEGEVVPFLLMVYIFGKECPPHTLNNEAPLALSLRPNSINHKRRFPIYYKGLSLDRGIGPHNRRVFRVKG